MFYASFFLIGFDHANHQDHLDDTRLVNEFLRNKIFRVINNWELYKWFPILLDFYQLISEILTKISEFSTLAHQQNLKSGEIK